MKNQFILFFLLLAPLLFSHCGSDDDNEIPQLIEDGISGFINGADLSQFTVTRASLTNNNDAKRIQISSVNLQTGASLALSFQIPAGLNFEPGTYEGDPGCNQSSTAVCANTLFIDTDGTGYNATSNEVLLINILEAGEVVGQRIAGTFEGSMLESDFLVEVIEVVDGQFNLELN